MTDEKCRICRLCLHVIYDNSMQPLEEITTIVQSVLPRLNLNISSNPIICGTCNELVHKSYKHKLFCLETNNRFYMEKNICSGFSIAKVKEERVTEDNCCGFCSQPVEDGHFKEFSKLETGMMETCIPEVDPFLMQNAVICEKCLERLHVHYNFVEMCSSVEEKINSYCRAYSNCASGEVDLQNILEFSLMTEKYADGLEIKVETLDAKPTEISVQMNENRLIKEEMSIKEESKMEVQINETPKIENQQVSEAMEEIVLQCTECTYLTTKKQLFKRHLMIHEDPNELQTFKRQKSKNKSDLKNHTAVHEDRIKLEIFKHSQGITLECSTCTYLTTDKRLFRRHLLVHQDPSEVQMFKCRDCDYQTKLKSNLTKHTLVHKHPTELEMFKCTQCKYQAKRKKELRIHNMLIHKAPGEVAMYNCNECSYQTKQKSSLTKHFLVHKSKEELAMKNLMHQCPHCPYTSKQKCVLNQHMLLHKKLEESNLYKCSQCSFKSIYKGSLVKHSLVHKGINEAAMYDCDICSFSTKTKKELKSHMKIHDKEFKCNECFFETKYKNMFDEHVRSHEIASER